MSFELEGKLHKIFEVERKSDKFQARDFVVEMADGNYPQFIKFQCVQERTGIVDAFKEGDTVKVSFDLRGREWNGKYFTNLNAWRVESGVAEQATPSMPMEEVAFPTAPSGGDAAFPSEDLPF